MGSEYAAPDVGLRAWAERQIIEAGYDVDPSDHVAHIALELVHRFDELQALMPDEAKKAADIAAHLIQRKPLTEEHWSAEKVSSGYRWVPLLPRSVQPGDVVRVRQDAYSSPDMERHNGMQGTVSAIRGGIYVIYDAMREQGWTMMGVMHKPDALERRIHVAKTP